MQQTLRKHPGYGRGVLCGLTLALALGHGLHDFVASWLVARYVAAPDWISVIPAILLFNLLAFALQPLWGWLTDRYGGYCPAVCIGLTGALLALWLPSGLAGLLLHGVASALFHVGAGGWLGRVSARPVTLGVFAAPGVMGSMVGVAAAVYGWSCVIPVSVLLAVVLILSLFWRRVQQIAETSPLPLTGSRGFYIAAGLPLLLITLQSSAWLPVHQQSMNDVQVLLLVGLIAGTGKLFGSLVCQWVGIWRWITVALSGTLLLWLWPANYLLLGWGGLLLLQSTLVPLWFAVKQTMPGYSALAAGLCLGLAFALGGVPMALNAEVPSEWCVALAVLLLGLAGLITWAVPRRLRLS